MTTELITLTDVKGLADRFGFSPEWVRDQCRKHGWPHSRFGRNIRFTPEQVAAILTIHEHQESQPAPRTRRTHTRRRAA
jgi:hypothetical protein